MQYFSLEKFRLHPVPGQRHHDTNVVCIGGSLVGAMTTSSSCRHSTAIVRWMGARNTPFLPQRNPEEAALHSGTERSHDDDEVA